MQAAAQKWVDSSISKTINCPEDISFEAFKDVYLQAWDSGLQGLHDLSPNDVKSEAKPVTGSREMSVSEQKTRMRIAEASLRRKLVADTDAEPLPRSHR